jgi:hypothetical protein
LLTETQKRQIQSQGFGKTGDIGGQPKTKYWTPDGREMLAQPSLHEYVRRKDGKTETGVRDSNLDKGWLVSKPLTLIPYCPHCDKWHETKELVFECGKKKQAYDNKYKKIAEAELKKENSTERIDKLESDMSDIKGMLKKLLEK